MDEDKTHSQICLKKTNSISKEAFKSFKQSLRFNPSNWKVLQNLVATALEVGEFSECIEAMKELLTLKETEPVDVPALSLLIKYVMQDLINGTTPAGALVHKQLSGFMSEVEMKVSDNPALWNLYAEYWRALGNWENAIMYRNKQCRALQKVGWEDTKEMFEPLVDACEKLSNDAVELNNEKQLYSCKLFINSIYKKSINSFDGTELQVKLKQVLDDITEKEAQARKK